MIQKAVGIVQESGLVGFGGRAIAFAYRRGVRPLLPSVGHARYAGIPVSHERKVGDQFVPALWRPRHVNDLPEYEAALVAELETHVRPGDRVVVVGGGVGVTATLAALHAGSSGTVECFEGAEEGAAKVAQTAQINGVSDRVTVHHAVVARSIAVYGTEPSHSLVAPSELPGCDVLELDCEGAELDILRGMTIRPRVVLVETHGLYGAPTAVVTSVLDEIGYRTMQKGVAEPRLQSYCEAHDIRLVVGVARPEATR